MHCIQYIHIILLYNMNICIKDTPTNTYHFTILYVTKYIIYISKYSILMYFFTYKLINKYISK